MNRFTFLLRLPIILMLAHAYVAWRLAMAAPGALAWLPVVVLAAMYGAVLAGFLRRRSVGEARGDLLAWCGFVALGTFSWLFVLCVLRDVVLAVWRLAALAAPFDGPAPQVVAVSAAAVVGAAAVAAVVGLVNARRRARIKEVEIALPGLAPAFEGFTIVQLSDVHVGATIKRGYVQAIVDAANALEPDLVAVTGDIVDGSVERLAHDVAPLGALRARHGVYAVTGNHEYYSGAHAWVDELRRIGITVLMNQHVVLEREGERLVVAGVTDYGAAAFDHAHASDPARALDGAPEACARILLAHQPRSARAAEKAGFDLQLSGHTHGGQFVPWNFFVPLQQPFVAGLHRHGRLLVYVSRGTGYWGPPMRLGAPSEITRIRLRSGIGV